MYGPQSYNPWFGPPFPLPTAPQNNQNPADVITGWITSLETLKKAFKEEKKDTPKKSADVSPLSMMLFMLLISPITAPAMYHFFQLSLGLLR